MRATAVRSWTARGSRFRKSRREQHQQPYAWCGADKVQARQSVVGLRNNHDRGTRKRGLAGVAGGFGDVTVSLLVLQWKPIRLGASQLNQRFVLDFDLPVGEYRKDTPVSLSGHAFSVHPYYAFTFSRQEARDKLARPLPLQRN